ncbi:MAG: hypothetical protein ABSH50_32495 [Bryobacteraceae bacterium]|jgi:hypothetical protein
MAKIRQEQEDLFRQEAEADFNRRVLLHIRRDLTEPAASMSDEDILRRVRDCGPRAAKYGLITERHLICFVDASILLGPAAFEEQKTMDWARKLLNSDKVSPTDKANLLLATACSVYRDSHGGNQ